MATTLKLGKSYSDDNGTTYEVNPTAEAFFTVSNQGWRIDRLFNDRQFGWGIELVVQTKSGRDSKAINRFMFLTLENSLRPHYIDVANMVDATIKEIA